MPESVTDRCTRATEPIIMLTKRPTYFYDTESVRDGGHNLWDYWVLSPDPYKGSHYAAFPRELPCRCISAATPIKSCAVCGAPWGRVVERTPMKVRPSERVQSRDPQESRTACSGTMTKPPTSKTLGHRPTCTCNADTRPAIVLDPFCGSGTTCAVAEDLGRLWIGFDISEEYRELQRERTEQVSLTGALIGGTP
jgi:hypothetical protein